MSNLQEHLGGLPPARDRRLQTRTTPASLAYVMLDDTNGGIVLNISETGMAIAVADLLVVGDYLPRIRFQLPSSSQSIEISAQIVWLAESKKGAGFRFVDLTADARNQISNWIASEKPATGFDQLPKPLRSDKQPLEIGSRKYRRIFSNPSARDEEAAARYAEMFPSESTYAKHTNTVDKIKPQQGPLPTPVKSNTDPGDSMLRSATKISTDDLPQTFSLPQVQTASELVAPSASHTPVIFDLSGLQVAALVLMFAVIGLIIGIAATKGGVDALVSLGRGPFGKQVQLHSQSPHTQSANGPTSDSAPIVAPTETSSAQTSRSSVDLDSSPGAKTAGSSRPIEEKAKEGTRDSEPSVKVPSTDSNSSTTLKPKPSADPEERPNRNDLTGLIARSVPLPSSAGRAHSAVAVGPIRSAPRNRALLTTKPATAAAPKPSPPTASLKHSYPAVAVGPRGTVPGNPASHTAKPAAAAVPKPSPSASPEPANSPKAAGPISAAPRNPVPRGVMPATGAASYQAPRSAFLFTAPAEGSKPTRVIFPEKLIAGSSMFEITSRLSVLVSPEPGPEVAHQPARLQPGELVSYFAPRFPRPGFRYGLTDTVKVRVTIGQLGQVMDIKPVSGPNSLLPATMSAIRVWRYKPTLLNERPVQAQQDVTIEFRQPQ